MHMQAVTVDPGPKDANVLVVRIAVTCDVCGEYEIVLAGHHLRPLLSLLQSVVDEAPPALVDGGEVEIQHRERYEIPDPKNN